LPRVRRELQCMLARWTGLCPWCQCRVPSRLRMDSS
jgi:hypothetical protein